VWQARVVVTDTATGAIGSTLHTFEVRRRTASSMELGAEAPGLGR
jgi:hypothetical protein